MDRLWTDTRTEYTQHIVDEGKEQALWCLVAFLVTFVITRIITHAIRDGRGPFRNVSVRGTHLHHLVPGILLMLVTGYLANALHLSELRNIVAVGFGIGAALTLDEFALWLHLEDVYWAKEGRRSVDAVIIAASLVGLSILGLNFWIGVLQAMSRL